MEDLINTMYTWLEAHMIESHNTYIGNRVEILERIRQLITLAQPGEPVNRCVVCKLDMGQLNPRQYCAKTHCANSQLSE